MKRELILNGLDCAHCAAEIEEKIQKLDSIQEAHVDFMSKKLTVIPKNEKSWESLKTQLIKIITDMEPDVVVGEAGESYSLFFKGLDCAHCAAEIEDEIRKVVGVESVSVDFMSTTCTYRCQKSDKARIEQEIRTIVNTHEPDVIVETVSTDKEEDRNFKKDLIRIFIGAGLFVIGFLQPETSLLGIVFVLGAYVLLGYDVVFRAVRNILKGQWFDENFLMALATIVAILLQDYREAVAVMLFYQVGEYFQERAVYSSRKSIADLMDIRPDIAHVIKNGETVDLSPELVQISDVVVVKPGERIPLDGIVQNGVSSLDTSSLTGESLERDVEVGDEVLSGCVNLRGLIEVVVTKAYSESTVSKILELVENTSSRKTKSENFITKFSKIYTPIVVILAVIIAITLPIIVPGISYVESIERACAFLVISCPCALVISIPLGFFAGIGGLSKNGILVKGSTVIESLSTLQQMVFDKTGTITQGKFGVSKILGEQKAIEYAAYAESNSTHPIAKSILDAYKEEVDTKRIQEVEEIAGHGIRIVLDGETILVGNTKLMDQFNIKYPVIDELGTLVYVSKNNEYIGTLVIEDQLKQDSKQAIQSLKKAGIKNCVMLTGDRKAVADHIASQVGIDSVYSECLPNDKVNVVESLLPQGNLGFAGDGINDAPVLALADLGFAMGGVGSDAAIEAADVVIMDDNLNKIPLAINRSKKTMGIVKQNIVGALGIKLLVLALAAFGFVNMWLAIFADVGVSIIAILNSIRLLKK
ncbi:heavy metal translocating P-type ATPase [Anaerorhabdus furcosa]|uniref:Cd(2+)-exporting ATPase n=1 Tax=Anaerorhabdus furcosa TaxID=118967 RepID=A0A1T4MKJ3_9FIRM|nr:heavy metal translocating P-type ATPase [Anaerorhabdus furcosa]SJZ67610.1 Cd2+/Zn2+-exporting ATPase [Anaerorhabdus furcosa]